MPRAFIDLPPEALFARLESAGFQLAPPARNEVVWERTHDKDPRWTVRVYTSISTNGHAHGCGSDAIRVVALLHDKQKTYPIYKAKRVHRMGTVDGTVERVIERCRDAYRAINERLAREKQR